MKYRFLVTLIAATLFLLGGCNNVETKNSEDKASVIQNTVASPETVAQPEEVNKKPETQITIQPSEMNNAVDVPKREVEGIVRSKFKIIEGDDICSQSSVPKDFDRSKMEYEMTLGAYTLYGEPMTLVCDTPYLLNGSCAIANNKPFLVVKGGDNFLFQRIKPGSVGFKFTPDEMRCYIVERQ